MFLKVNSNDRPHCDRTLEWDPLDWRNFVSRTKSRTKNMWTMVMDPDIGNFPISGAASWSPGGESVERGMVIFLQQP